MKKGWLQPPLRRLPEDAVEDLPERTCRPQVHLDAGEGIDKPAASLPDQSSARGGAAKRLEVNRMKGRESMIGRIQ
ncbi:MAG: hypothetical protein LCH99_00225, partial [Proteobacteria bacterium]|nr:hypothetical protein [Pseudomonadota bacterium]